VENIEHIRTAALQIPQYKQLEEKLMPKIQMAQIGAGPEVMGLIKLLVDQRTGETRAEAAGAMASPTA
jgi:hypothetical protein